MHSLYRNPSNQAARAIATLSEKLNALLSQWASPEEVLAGAAPLDPETVRRLESLGYLSGPSADGAIGQLDPKDMMSTFEDVIEAKCLADVGDYEGALAKAAEARRRSPRDRFVLHHLGRIYAHMGRLAEAEQALRQYIEIKPSADVCVLLAQTLILQRRNEEAEALLAQAASLDPNQGGIYIAHGDMMAQQGRTDEAIRCYEQAKRVDPYRAVEISAARIARTRDQMSESP